MTTDIEVPAATPAQERFRRCSAEWLNAEDPRAEGHALNAMCQALNDQIAELRRALCEATELNLAVHNRLILAEWSIEDLMAGRSIAEHQPPIGRLRVNLALRGKLPAGWSASEVTAELTAPVPELTEEALMGIALVAGNAGERVAHLWNGPRPDAEEGGEG